MAYSGAAYLAVGLLLYFRQESLIFPAPKTWTKARPPDCGLAFTNLRIPLNAAQQIHAWWIPAAEETKRVILAFHGNGYVLEDMVGDELRVLHATGANVLAIDYRGYGLSSKAAVSERTVDEDARAALAYLREQRRVSTREVYVLGRSVGSGPATQLAIENAGLGGLILESPFTSIDDAAASYSLVRLYPLGWMLQSHFDNLSKIGSIRTRLLIISGTADTLTPAWMARALYAKAAQPKEIFLVADAGHDDLVSVGGVRLMEVVRRFARQD